MAKKNETPVFKEPSLFEIRDETSPLENSPDNGRPPFSIRQIIKDTKWLIIGIVVCIGGGVVSVKIDKLNRDCNLKSRLQATRVWLGKKGDYINSELFHNPGKGASSKALWTFCNEDKLQSELTAIAEDYPVTQSDLDAIKAAILAEGFYLGSNYCIEIDKCGKLVFLADEPTQANIPMPDSSSDSSVSPLT